MMVVLLSGGLDSTVALAHVLQKTDRVLALTIDYGQRHQREIQSAQRIAKFYNVEHLLVNLDRRLFLGNPLVGKSGEIPKIDYSDIRGLSPLYVPFRNGIFVSRAAAVCLQTYKSGSVVVAWHLSHEGTASYPDTSINFFQTLNSTLLEGTDGRIDLFAPFLLETKSQIVERGRKLKVPFDLTWSCYDGGDFPCRQCPTCRERLIALGGN